MIENITLALVAYLFFRDFFNRKKQASPIPHELWHPNNETSVLMLAGQKRALRMLARKGCVNIRLNTIHFSNVENGRLDIVDKILTIDGDSIEDMKKYSVPVLTGRVYTTEIGSTCYRPINPEDF